MIIAINAGLQLSDLELSQVNEAIVREFNVKPLSKNDISEKLFFSSKIKKTSSR